jgi:hypothetical protein
MAGHEGDLKSPKKTRYTPAEEQAGTSPAISNLLQQHATGSPDAAAPQPQQPASPWAQLPAPSNPTEQLKEAGGSNEAALHARTRPGGEPAVTGESRPALLRSSP